MLSNLFGSLPAAGEAEEVFNDLLAVPGLRIERIVSHGQCSPPGFWYDQGWDEWVLVLQGEAGLQIHGREAVLALKPGDHAWLPAGLRHRVAYTSTLETTVWLAVHRGESVSMGAE
ncbi:MAG: cupin domain-containing protein [Burkholderiaceae bacterium]